MANFIVFSLSRWNIEFGCNIKDISTELSSTHNVLYIDLPLKRKERFLKRNEKFVKEATERIKSRKNLLQLSASLWHYIPDEVLESVNGISNHYIFDFFNYINNRRFARSIRKAAKAVGFTDYILLNDNDIYNGFYLQKFLNPSLYVYYLRDRLPAMSYWKKHAGRLEGDLIRQTDLVVANSQYLADYASAFNPHSYYVGQGCDISHFLVAPPTERTERAFGAVAHPRAGYIGALNSERLDLKLIRAIAQKMPDVNFVLVGHEDAGFAKSDLHSAPNIFFMGRKDFSELPELLYGFDVAINPQVINDITIGNYPRKVDEYLAAGKPVVATLTPTMRPFENHVYLGVDADSYVALIRKALEEDNAVRRQARQSFASTHTWKNNVDEILKSIDLVKHGKKKK